MNLSARVRQHYRELFDEEPLIVARAPGRVNLLGEHVDYNDGFVLPAAIDRAVWVACSPSRAPHSTLVAVDLNEKTFFSPQTLPAKTDIYSQPLPHWAKYSAGVMWVLSEAGYHTPNFKAVFTSDVPRGAGLSSSAAVEMAFMMAFFALGEKEFISKHDPITLARLAQRAENEYVGVRCGIMDQFASACGKKDHALFLDCRSLDWQTVPLPANVAIVVADTSVPRSLSESAYNERRAACEEAARSLGVKSLRDISVQEFHRIKHKLSSPIARRAQHVVEEIQRTEQSVFLLKQGNIKAFGRLMNECHVSLRDLYEVSSPELDVMVEIAQSLPGCYGARLTGAGFGGCTVNLVAWDQVEEFVRELGIRYKNRTNREAKIYVCRADDGAGFVSSI
ncbi:MAG TPA: galactokinase [Anaerolineales bacterium]|nr:galactokinase [Anaerolineales bacterium]